MKTTKTYKYEMTWEQKNQILMMASYFKHIGKEHKMPIVESIINMMLED